MALLSQTRSSLIRGLKDMEDAASWQDFYESYVGLIHSVSSKMGASSDLAEEITQEVFVRVAKKIGDFEYDPNSGKFRNWLCTIAKNIYIDFSRKAALKTLKTLDFETNAHQDFSDEFNRIWELEWIQNHIRVALIRTKKKVSIRQYQIFYLVTIQEYSSKEAAQLTGSSLPQVYMAKMRVSKIFKAELAFLRDEQS